MKVFLTVYLFLFSGILANPQAPFVLKPHLSQEDLTPYLEIHEDISGKMGIVEVRGKQFSPLRDPNLGYSDSAFWIRWTLENPDSRTQTIFLKYDFSLVDRLELYDLSSEEPIRVLGDQVAFSKRDLDYRNPVFILDLEPGSSKHYYLKIQSESTIPVALSVISPSRLHKKISQENFVFGIYYGGMLVMILYNLFLFVFTRVKKYLFYVVFILNFTFFQFILNGFAFQYIWPNSPFLTNQSLLVFMILATVSACLFTAYFLKARAQFQWLYRVYQGQWAMGGFVLFLSFFVSYSVGIRLATYFAIASALLLLAHGIYTAWIGNRAGKIYLTAFSLFSVGAILYACKSVGILPSNAWTNWTIQIGSALHGIILSLGLADRINELSHDLKKRIGELAETNGRLRSSEERFRELFHGVSDIIFVLDSNWNVIDINRAATKHLGFKPDELKGKNILEMVYKGRDLRDTYNRIFVMEKLEELHDTGNPVDLQADFQQKYVMEPKEMYIKLQYVQLENTREILGTASVMVEDILGRFLETERIVFSMNNYLRNAEIISHKLTAHIARFSDPDTLVAVRTALREILINAVEHGNLAISFDEKSKAMNEGNYLQFIQNRQNDPRYKDRKVRVEYVLDSKKVAFRITDEGGGFDHRKMLDTRLDKLNEESIQHGRGIVMTRDVFDIVEYNDKGNQVSLVKYFR